MRAQRSRTFFGVFSAIAFAFLYTPLIVVVVFSFNSARYGGTWKSFSLEWYQSLWSNDVAISAAKTTFVLGATSTAVATLLGTLLALGLARRFPARRICEASLLVPIVIPDIVMAVALLMFYGIVREAIGLFQPGLITMIVAHVTFEIPFVTMVVRARLAGFDQSLEEAARDLGATPWQTFRHVKFPLIWPGILAGALLAFTLSLDDFVVSFFTTGPGATTLPILVYSSVKRGITPEINALSTLFIAASVLATLGVAALQRRLRH